MTANALQFEIRQGQYVFSKIVHTDHGARVDFYSIVSGDAFFWVKAAGAWRWRNPPSAEVENEWSYYLCSCRMSLYPLQGLDFYVIPVLVIGM